MGALENYLIFYLFWNANENNYHYLYKQIKIGRKEKNMAMPIKETSYRNALLAVSYVAETDKGETLEKLSCCKNLSFRY